MPQFRIIMKGLHEFLRNWNFCIPPQIRLQRRSPHSNPHSAHYQEKVEFRQIGILTLKAIPFRKFICAPKFRLFSRKNQVLFEVKSQNSEVRKEVRIQKSKVKKEVRIQKSKVKNQKSKRKSEFRSQKSEVKSQKF